MKGIIVRGANGVIVWRRRHTSRREYAWVNTRDSFSVPMPIQESDLEARLVALVQHSQQVVGAVSQVVELDI